MRNTMPEMAERAESQYRRLSGHDWYMLANLHNVFYPHSEGDKIRLLFEHEESCLLREKSVCNPINLNKERKTKWKRERFLFQLARWRH